MTSHKSQYGYIGHRRVWKLVNGPIPDKMCICHKCDNKGCINPEHLWIGTQQDNMDDMVTKGRDRRGSYKILSDKQVKEIRDDKYCSGYDLAKKYKVSPKTIYTVKNNRY